MPYNLLAFDFDGTLFDTQPLLNKAYQLAYFDLGYEIPNNLLEQTRGLNVKDFKSVLNIDIDVDELHKLKDKYYSQFILSAKPNTHLLKLLKGNPFAIVTGARMCGVKPLLDKYSIKPDFLITQEDVIAPKPNPQPYKLLIEQSHIPPQEVLAFEDSRAGFVSARSAGLDCFLIKSFDNPIKCGGSGDKVLLDFVSKELVVRKIAFNERANLLKKQCAWLQRHNEVDILDMSETTEYFSYAMPYIFATSLDKYQNKLGVLPAVIEKLYSISINDYSENNLNVGERLFNENIKLGCSIAKKDFPIQIYEIPDFVNYFRVTDFHGDPTFENTLIKRDGSVVLIDPSPENNPVNGIVHDFSKIAQSLCGYEAIRDKVDFDYCYEKRLFNELAQKYLTLNEYKSLKFYTGCLFLRRLKHQIKQEPALVEPYFNIAQELFNQFKAEDYEWK